MTDTEQKLFLFAAKLHSRERPDLTMVQVVRDVDRRLDLGLKEAEVRRLHDILSIKPTQMRPSQLLDRPNKWTDVGIAQTEEGIEVDANHHLAAKWSLHGALIKCGITHKKPLYDQLQARSRRCDPETYNSRADFAAIIALLRSVGL